MPKLANDNWIYDDDNALHAKKASDVLRRAKNARIGKKFIRIVTSTSPYTIIEKEDPNGEYLYGRRRK